MKRVNVGLRFLSRSQFSCCCRIGKCNGKRGCETRLQSGDEHK